MLEYTQWSEVLGAMYSHGQAFLQPLFSFTIALQSLFSYCLLFLVHRVQLVYFLLVHFHNNGPFQFHGGA